MKDIHVCRIYIPPCNSKYFDPEIFDQLEQDIIDVFLRQDQLFLLETSIQEPENTAILSHKKATT